jgi:hypothetical protein
MAELFPSLLSKVTDFTVEPLDRQGYILGLLLLKRVYLYAAALVGVDWMAKRSLTDGHVGLGEKLANLNEEIFDGIPMLSSNTTSSRNLGSEFNAQSAPLLSQLDDMEGGQKAIALPVLVALSLLASFAGLQLSQLATTRFLQQEQASSLSLPLLLGQEVPQLLSLVATVAVVTLFSKAEIARLLRGNTAKINCSDGGGSMLSTTATGVAATVSVLATLSPVFVKLLPHSPYWSGLGLWPLGNAANLLVGATISRAFQLPTLSVVLSALCALVAYDVFFVFGTQSTLLTDGGQSIMEAVALAKVQSGGDVSAAGAGAGAAAVLSSTSAGAPVAAAATAAVASLGDALGSLWRPGLLQVNLNGKTSDALGLGDVIFPSLLAGWALRYDRRSSTAAVNADTSTGGEGGVYNSALGGYALGCLLCELFQTGAGQPALLYVVPAMVATMASANFALLVDEESRNELFEFEGY